MPLLSPRPVERPLHGIELRTHYVLAGQLFVSAEPCAVTTILGSCVSVALWDPTTGIGGLNHYLLPYRVESERFSPRFGSVAMEQLVGDLTSLGCRRGDLCAKVFGGAAVLGVPDGEVMHLGLRNAALAREVLTNLEIPILAEDVGGRRGRKLVFHTHDGSAWVQKL